VRAHVERLANPPGAQLSWRDLAEGVQRVRDGQDVNYSGASGSVTIGGTTLDPSLGLIQFMRVEGAQIGAETFSACPMGTLPGL
jgi:hypothetical protein